MIVGWVENIFQKNSEGVRFLGPSMKDRYNGTKESEGNTCAWIPIKVAGIKVDLEHKSSK